jgi:hypothetical protein
MREARRCEHTLLTHARQSLNLSAGVDNGRQRAMRFGIGQPATRQQLGVRIRRTIRAARA